MGGVSLQFGFWEEVSFTKSHKHSGMQAEILSGTDLIKCKNEQNKT